MKSGFLSSEFWIHVLAGAICAGSAMIFNQPLDLNSLIGILTIVEGYTWSRVWLKHTHAQAVKEILELDPHAKDDILGIATPVIDKVMSNQTIGRVIAKEVVKNTVDKL